MRMRHEEVHFEKKKFLTNSGRKKSAPSQRDPPAKIVIAKFLYQNDSKRLYVVSLHCWRCTLSISSFPLSRHSWIAKGSMRSISMTIAHPAAQVAGCSGALRAITVGAENARSRVLAGPRDSGRHFVSKCSHCACSVSHERGPNARSYVKSPPPPPSSPSR